MTSDPIQDAIDCYRNGQGDRARALLKQVIQENPGDEAAWYWYIEMLPTLTARIRALETFLTFSPDNQKARIALSALIKQRNDLQESRTSVPSETSEAPPREPPPRSAVVSRPLPSNTKAKPRRTKSVLIFVGIAVSLILVSAAIFLLKPFTPKQPSEQEIYARDMEPVLKNIQNWQEGPITMWGIKMISKDSWGISTYQENIQDPTLRMLRRDELILTLIPITEEIAQAGEGLLTAMKATSPPEDITEQHLAVNRCIEYQIRKAHATAAYIQNDTISQLGEDYCRDFSTAFTELQSYIDGD
jgi:hypothetical protein